MKKYFLFAYSFFLIVVNQTAYAQTTTVDSTKHVTQIDSSSGMKQEMPSCECDLQQYLAMNTKYPQMEREAGKQGVVYVQFVVEKDGSISNVAVAKSGGSPGLDREAVRVISTMPKWNPGKLNGNPVRVQITQPVRFVLETEDPHKKKKKHSK